MERDRNLEQSLLAGAEALPIYTEQVLARLDHYDEDNGGNAEGWDQSLDRLLVEAQEEAADVSGWLIGAAQQLDPTLRSRLVVAMRLAGVVYSELEELRMHLAEAEDRC